MTNSGNSGLFLIAYIAPVAMPRVFHVRFFLAFPATQWDNVTGRSWSEREGAHTWGNPRVLAKGTGKPREDHEVSEVIHYGSKWTEGRRCYWKMMSMARALGRAAQLELCLQQRNTANRMTQQGRISGENTPLQDG